MLKKLQAFTLTAAISFSVAPAQAAKLVHDPINMGEAVAQGVQMAKQLAELKRQLDQAVRHYQAVTGSRGMGSMNNGFYDQQIRRTLPNNWDELMSAAGTGNSQSLSAYTSQVLDGVSKQYRMIDGAKFSTLNTKHAGVVDRNNNAATVNMGISEVVYNKTADRRNTYEKFLQEIDKTPDLKASTDLNARIAAENGLLMNEIIRIMAADLNQSASSKMQELSNDKISRDRHRLK